MTAQITFPSYIVPPDPEQPRGLITAEEWNNLWNLIITQGNLTTQEVELLEELLASVTDGSSGADSIGATAISGLTGATVQALLEALQASKVTKTGDETISGTKTFSDSVVVGNSVTIADGKVSANSFDALTFNASQGIKENGIPLVSTYQKITNLPNAVRNIVLEGLSTITKTVITASDSVISAFGKLQAQITDHKDNLANPHSVTNTQVGLGNVINVKQATEANFNAHTANTTNPHSVTKTQVGLGSVDNTSDLNKPVSTAQAAALSQKVDKVTGKSLILDTLIAKLESIAAGAEVNVQSDWNEVDTGSDAFIKNKPALGTVASKNTGTTAGTIPIIGVGDKLPLSVIPASAITDVGAFATIAERDAWTTADTGDVALVADPPSTYIRSSENTWLLMPTPTDSVLSVAGKTGAVTLTAADVTGALTVSDILNMLTSTATDKALSANQGKVLKDICDTIAGNLSTHLTAYGTFVANTNTALGDRVESSTIQAVRYNLGVFEFTTDGTNWLTLTGAKGDQGRGYTPRGAWVSGGTYTFDTNTIDVVEYDGTSYYCKVSHTGSVVLPFSDTTNWGVLAEAGSLATGEDVILTDYTIAASYGSVAPTDNVNQAIGKIEKNLSKTVDLSSTQTLENKTLNYPNISAPRIYSPYLHDINMGGLDGDHILTYDPGSSDVKYTSNTSLKNYLKDYFDALYAAINHTHAQSDITNLTTDLAGKAKASSMVTATLATASWVGSAAPYTQNVTVSGMTASKNFIVGAAANITDAQFEAMGNAKLRVSAQSTNTITITAMGDKPAINLPITVTLLG